MREQASMVDLAGKLVDAVLRIQGLSEKDQAVAEIALAALDEVERWRASVTE